MSRKPMSDPNRLREEIAIVAARLVAQDGLDYANAKRKAVRQIVGSVRVAGELLPDNEQIEEEVREYQALFQSDTQPAVLRELRQIALEWMERLGAFNPYLIGAVLNGTASEHSDIRLQLFCENSKDVSIFLLNAGISYDVTESRHFAGRGAVETLSFITRSPLDGHPIGLVATLYSLDDLRGSPRADGRGRLLRANAAAVAKLLEDGADASLIEPPAP